MPFNPDDYRNPQCVVLVAGAQLKSSTYSVESVKVQVSAEEEANSCEVTIVADYDNKSSGISGGLTTKIVAGKKVEVKLGYSQTKSVFMGYINSVSVSYSEEGIIVSFSCLDARGLLMGNKSWQGYENESISQVIKSLLTPVSSFTDGVEVKVEGEADKENPITQNDLDDYHFLCNLAKLTNSSFCMPGTKLKFVSNVFESGKTVAKYKWGRDILSFERTVELAEQLGSVKVSGNAPDTIKEFSATAKPPSGKGKTGAQLNSGVKAKELEVTSFMVKNQKEAQAYAKSLMFDSAIKLCQGSARVLGNEKLIPGEKVEFDGLDKAIDGDYFITSVTHSFSAEGFLSTIGFARTTA